MILLCHKCNQSLDSSLFYIARDKPTGHMYHCKECDKKIQRIRDNSDKRRKYHAMYSQIRWKNIKENPEENNKQLCRMKTRYYVRVEKIKKENCLICGSKETQIHHLDYKMPPNIVFLCNLHHNHKHLKLMDK